MGIFDGFKNFWTAPAPEVQTRSGDSIDDLIARMGRARANPWRAATIKEALGVPAIFGAVNLIANSTASMSMKTYRGEIELAPSDRPRVVVRPDPFTIAREFYRRTAWNLASRGEAWWWIAKRDGDGMPLSVLSVPPRQVMVEEDPNDLRYPIITWRGVQQVNSDFLQLIMAAEDGELRGSGPLQMCGAAVSVAVEAQHWAANFYAEGGGGGTLIKAAGFLGASEDENGLSEADRLRAQWIDSPNNVPRVIDEGIESVTEREVNQQGAQMMQARGYQNIEIATMFNIPGAMLNAAIQGSSLTYQTVESKYADFLKECLEPNYLEPIEQTMSDLLPRSQVARFNTSRLTLADVKTRYEVYKAGVEAGIITVEEARRFEGLAPGDVENASVPYSPPAAFPTSLPVENRTALAVAAPVTPDLEVRCQRNVIKKRSGIARLEKCNRLLNKRGAPPSGRCARCKFDYDQAEAVA